MSKARLIALFVFWTPVAYVVCVVFGSMLLELYGSEKLRQAQPYLQQMHENTRQERALNPQMY